MAEKRSEGWTSSWYADETPIVWEVPGNPKRPHGKSYARFQSYFGAQTVGEYFKSGGTKGDLKYDWTNAFLSLGFPENDPDEIIEKALVEMSKTSRSKKKVEVPVITDSSEADLLT